MNWQVENSSRFFRRAMCFYTLLVVVASIGAGTCSAIDEKAPPRLWELKLPTICNSSPAIGTNGSIYFGNFDGQLWAVGTNGLREWSVATSMEIWSSPAVAADGTIYFGCRDRHLYAVTSGGRKKWRFKTGGWVDASAAIGNNGTIYFGSWDKNFYAVDATGHEVWRFATGGPVISSAAIGTNGMIYFGSHDGNLYALSPEGREVWRFKTGGAILSSPALDAEEGVFVTSVDGYLYVLNKDGKLRWKLHTGSRNKGSPVLGLDGRVFLALNDEVWAIKPGGERAWTACKDEVNSTPLVAADGMVFFVTEHGQMQGCDHERSLPSLWSVGVPYNAVCSPNLSGGGNLYVLGHWLLCAYAWPSTVAPTPWPKFRGNARNTGNQADWLK